MLTGVGVEKLTRGNSQKKIASGCPINDFLCSARHFLSPNFGCFSRKATCSTPTGDFTSDRDCEIAPFEQLRRTTLLDSVCLLQATTSEPPQTKFPRRGRRYESAKLLL